MFDQIMVTPEYWNRETQPNADSAFAFTYMPRTKAGPRIDHDSALAYSAVWACVRVISETIGQMAWHVHRRVGRGSELAPMHPADMILQDEANDELAAVVWREVAMKDVLTWGNHYSEIERDGSGRVIALWPIDPERVTVRREIGGLRYEIHNQGTQPTMLSPGDVFHLRGLGDDLVGWSVIAFAAQAIGLGISQQDTMSSLMKNEVRSSGLLTPVSTINKSAVEEIRTEYAKMASGDNKGGLMVLSHGFKFDAFTLPPSDAQLLEARQFSVLDICRFYRVPPHKVFDLTRATFSNIEHQSIEFVQDTIVPWVKKLEAEANRKLISRANRRTLFTKMNVNSLLRGDFESRMKGYQLGLDRGVYSINDVLELEDRNPIGSDGDKRAVPLNMQTLEQFGEEPEPAPVPEPEQEEPEEMPEGMAAYRPVLVDAVQLLMSRQLKSCESYAAKRAVSRCDNFWAKQQAIMESCLRPHADAIQRIFGIRCQLSVAVGCWVEQRAALVRQYVIVGDLSELAADWMQQVDAFIDLMLGVKYENRNQ